MSGVLGTPRVNNARQWLETLLHVHDTPERTARAFALGVLFGFSPWLGLHTLLGLIFAFALRLNRVAVLVGVYSNLPWIIGPYYALATASGALLLGADPPPDLADRVSALFALSLWRGEFWTDLVRLVRPFLWPFIVGSTLGSALLAMVAYRAALVFLAARARR